MGNSHHVLGALILMDIPSHLTAVQLMAALHQQDLAPPKRAAACGSHSSNVQLPFCAQALAELELLCGALQGNVGLGWG